MKNSFIKYGFDNHKFEVLELCEKERLNELERFWQDKFNVIGDNGLNCVLQSTTEKRRVTSKETVLKTLNTKIKNNTIRKGGENNKSKITLCLQTGIFYDCLSDACTALNLNYDTTRFKVRENIMDSLIYIENFTDKISVRKGRTTLLVRTVKDVKTNKIYKSIYHASSDLNISWTSLNKMLKGKSKNTTNLVFLNTLNTDDGFKGKIKKTPYNAKEVLCLSTGIFYPSLRESCTAMGINYGTAQVYMRVNKIKNLKYV